jgi:mRNA interferase YafQ
MKVIIPSPRFKKDMKRYKHNVKLQNELFKVLDFLRREEPLPIKYKAHKLIGNYSGSLECHVENDTLLIWIDDESDIITLVRIGSHSELF